MPRRVLFHGLQHMSVTGFFVLAITLNVCELPIRGHGHVAETPTADHRPHGHGDAHVSACEGSAMKPSAPVDATPDTAGEPVENRTPPITPPAERPPATTS